MARGISLNQQERSAALRRRASLNMSPGAWRWRLISTMTACQTSFGTAAIFYGSCAGRVRGAWFTWIAPGGLRINQQRQWMTGFALGTLMETALLISSVTPGGWMAIAKLRFIGMTLPRATTGSRSDSLARPEIVGQPGPKFASPTQPMRGRFLRLNK